MNNSREAVHTETDAALRTRALESLLVEKGLLTTDIIDEVVQKYEQDVGPLNGAKVVARAWSDPTTSAGYSKTAPRLLPNWDLATPTAAKSSYWKTQQASTTSSFAPFAPVIPGPYSACRRVGTNPTRIALGWCGSRERSCENLTSTYPIRSKFASGTATRIFATWCCPNALLARKTTPKNNSLHSSRATR